MCSTNHFRTNAPPLDIDLSFFLTIFVSQLRIIVLNLLTLFCISVQQACFWSLCCNSRVTRCDFEFKDLILMLVSRLVTQFQNIWWCFSFLFITDVKAICERMFV